REAQRQLVGPARERRDLAAGPLLAEGARSQRVLDDAERAVLPALGPVTADQGPGRAARLAAGGRRQAVADDLLREDVVDHLAPVARAGRTLAGRAVLARLGDGDERLRDDEAGVVVGARLVAHVALGGVPVDPGPEAA